MLQPGQQAPTFKLPGAGGGRIDTHGLAEYADNGWAVVVVFYPFDFHPVCTAQMCTLRDSEALSLLENTVVLGISTDGASATVRTPRNTGSTSRCSRTATGASARRTGSAPTRWTATAGSRGRPSS